VENFWALGYGLGALFHVPIMCQLRIAPIRETAGNGAILCNTPLTAWDTQ
jgi:hypothetical protein